MIRLSMARLFVSHSSLDNAAVERLKRLLDAEHVAAFIDFDPAQGIPPGRRWEDELNWQLASCVAVLYLSSRHSNASMWCFAELVQARARRLPVIALAVDRSPRPSLLADTQALVDLDAPEAELRQGLASALALARGRAEEPFAWTGARDLYPGMRAFDEADAAIFFGREAETDALLDLLERARLAGRRLACVVGASGSGKSSIVRAGVLPRLRRHADRWIVLAPTLAGTDLLPTLAEALVAAFVRKPALSTVLKALQAAARGDVAPFDTLLRRLRLARPASASGRVLLLIDQGERLFAPAAGVALAWLLACTAAPALPLQIVLTLRLDHLDRLQALLAERSLATDLAAIGPLSPAGVAQVIEGPAGLARITVERELVALLVNEAQGGDGLALLAFALHRLWQLRGRDAARITLADYREVLGGLEGAVAHCVDQTWSALQPDAAQQRALRALLVRMARLDERSAVVGQPVPLASVPAPVRPLVERLVDERLMLTRGSGAQATLDVVHEALFRAWKLLAQWIDEARAELAWRRDIAPAFATWRDSGCDIEAAHLSGRMLDAGIAWRASVGGSEVADGADAALLAFVDASSALAEHARRRADAALVRQIAFQAQVALASDDAQLCERGLLLAIEAMQRARNLPEARLEADQALRAGLALLARALAPFSGPATMPDAWAASPTEEFVVAVCGRQLVVWHPKSGQLQGVATLAHEVTQLAFSRDGKRLVGAGGDGWLLLWDLDSQRISSCRVVPAGAAIGFGHPMAVAFSPDGAVFAVASTACTRVWRFALQLAPAVQLPQGGSDAAVVSIDFADGEVLLEQRASSPAIAWRWQSAQRLGEVGGAGLQDSNQVLHSPDARFALTAGAGGEVWSWDALLQQRQKLADNGQHVAFSRDGRFAAMASPEHFVRLWRLPDFATVHRWRHGAAVWQVAFSPDGSAVAGAATNGVVRVHATDEDGLEQARIVCPGGTMRVQFSADSRTLVHQLPDGRLAAWDTRDLRCWVMLTAQTEVARIGFDSDGRHVAIALGHGPRNFEHLWFDWHGGQFVERTSSARVFLDQRHAAQRLPATSASGRLRVAALDVARLGVFDASAEGPPAPQAPSPRCVLKCEYPVVLCEFSPDDSMLATLAEDDHVRLWDLASGHELGRLALPVASVTALAFSADGRVLATAGRDGQVRIWMCQPDDLIAEARTRLARGFSAADIAPHLPEAR